MVMGSTTSALPFRIAPLNNIQPFTYRDGMSHLQLLEKLRMYINETLRIEFNGEMDRIIEEFNIGLDAQFLEIAATKDDWDTKFAAMMLALQNEIAVLNDAALASVVDDVLSLTRAAMDRLYKNPVLDVRDFGATLDGVTDDTLAVRDAFTFLAANPGRTLAFTKGGTVKLSEGLGRFALNNCTVDFGDTIIDASAIPTFNGDVLTIGGAQGVSRNLSGDLVAGAKAVVMDTTGFVAGDMVVILSNTVFDPARTGSKMGEINYVKSVDGAGALTLRLPATVEYTTATTARMVKLTPVQNVTIKGGRFLSTTTDNTLRGLFIEYGRNIRVEGVAFKGINRVQLQLGSTAESAVTGCEFNNAHHASQGYGCSVLDAAQDIEIAGNSFVEVRHSLSTNNSIAHGGIVRRINFHHNHVTSSATATGGSGGDAVDTHAGSEEISINYNTIYGSSGVGVNMEARSGEIIGNQITETATYGIQCIPYSFIPGRITIANNKMRRINGFYGIAVTASGADIEELNIVGNIVQGQVSGIRVFNSVNGKAKKATVSGNNVKAFTGTGITILNGSRVNVIGNTVDSAGNFGITLDGCSGSNVSGNVIDVQTTDGSAAHCIRVQGTADRVNVNGNNVEYTGTGVPGVRAVSFTATITDSNMSNNITRNTAFGYELGTGTGNVASNNL